MAITFERAGPSANQFAVDTKLEMVLLHFEIEKRPKAAEDRYEIAGVIQVAPRLLHIRFEGSDDHADADTGANAPREWWMQKGNTRRGERSPTTDLIHNGPGRRGRGGKKGYICAKDIFMFIERPSHD